MNPQEIREAGMLLMIEVAADSQPGPDGKPTPETMEQVRRVKEATEQMAQEAEQSSDQGQSEEPEQPAPEPTPQTPPGQKAMSWLNSGYGGALVHPPATPKLKGIQRKILDRVSSTVPASPFRREVKSLPNYGEKKKQRLHHNTQHAIGDVWQGPTGRWYTRKNDGKVAPTTDPNATSQEEVTGERLNERHVHRRTDEGHHLRPSRKPLFSPSMAQNILQVILDKGVLEEELYRLVQLLFDILMIELSSAPTDEDVSSEDFQFDLLERIMQEIRKISGTIQDASESSPNEHNQQNPETNVSENPPRVPKPKVNSPQV